MGPKKVLTKPLICTQVNPFGPAPKSWSCFALIFAVQACGIYYNKCKSFKTYFLNHVSASRFCNIYLKKLLFLQTNKTWTHLSYLTTFEVSNRQAYVLYGTVTKNRNAYVPVEPAWQVISDLGTRHSPSGLKRGQNHHSREGKTDVNHVLMKNMKLKINLLILSAPSVSSTSVWRGRWSRSGWSKYWRWRNKPTWVINNLWNERS